MKKMKIVIYPILCLFILQWTSLCKGQTISIHQLPIMEDLPSNSVVRLIQDKEGYMWFGTQDGLCRYDGYHSKVFRSDINFPNLLTSNHITSLSEDLNKRILIGTDEGLNILDKRTYNILPHPDTTLRHKTIHSILSAVDGKIWVGYDGGLHIYKSDLTLDRKFIYNPDDPNSFPDGKINHIYEDSYHNIWVLFWGKGLLKYNKENNQFVKYPIIGKNDNPFNMFQDDQNNYWIGTWNEGLYQFSPNNITTNTYKKVILPQWSNCDSRFFSFAQDGHSKYLWAMSLSGLITFKYDKHGKITFIDTQKELKKTNNIFSQIISDKNGNLWIGAFSEGVFKIEFNKPEINNFPLDLFQNNSNIAPSFTTICTDSQGHIWFNQNRRGIFIYSPEDQSLQNLNNLTDFVFRNELETVMKINYISSLNEVWLSNLFNDKILRFQTSENHIIKTNEIDLKNVSSNPGTPLVMFEDNHSNVWIGTETSLFVKIANSDSVSLIKENIGRVMSITQDLNNTIWIATSDNGMLKMTLTNTSTLHIEDLIIEQLSNEKMGNHIQTIASDQSGMVWIGTKEGYLLSYNTTQKNFTNRTIDCGLNGEAILDIITDKFNNIWITTYKKVIEFNPQNNASYSYTIDDGMQINSHLIGSIFKTKDEKYIYIGGNRGFSRFSPSEHLLSNPEQTSVKITDINIQNKSIFNKSQSAKFDNQSKTLTLKPNDQNIELHFSTLTYNSPNKIRYAYKLDGIDNDWIITKNDRSFALYNQLQKGKYDFWVKSSDSHNLWGDKISKITIIKLPALYETKLAIIIYISLIAYGIYILLKILISRIKLQSKIKMAEFEKFKTEELTQTKLNYFTNISHDLLTPLTIISCLIDDMETTSSKDPSQFSLMRTNIARLKRLLEQILDFRRIESGNMKLNITHSEITSLINDICQYHFIPVFEKKKINFTFNSNPKTISGYIDIDKIDKVLFNLLSNAFKFTHEEGNIAVTLNELHENDLKTLTIQISDSGCGIAPNDIDKIFTRFYTNKKMIASATHGIGLSLCKDLIQLHHGTIKVDSVLDKGTNFIIKIPIDKESYNFNEIGSDALIEMSEKNTSSHNENSEFNLTNSKESNIYLNHNINILIVDDNIDLLNLMKNILSRNYHILTATNGIEAIETTKRNAIDIMVSDVMMPEMDGIELCKNIKGNIESSHISVILLTAKNSINDRIECYNAGADAYISKPFEMGVLNARIHNFIKNKQNRQNEFKTAPAINISTLENHSMDEQFLNRAIEIIENNIEKTEFDINQFAEKLNLSKSSLYRKIKTLTGLSPIEFIRNIKLKHASEMLKNTTISISEVAYSVGFSDPKYFSSCFKTEFNISPSEFKKDYLK